MTPAEAPGVNAEGIRVHLDTLSELANGLAGQFELGPLLELILRHAMELLEADSGSVCTVDEVGGTYRKEVDLGVGCQSGHTFPLDEGVTGEVVRAGASVMFDDYSQVRNGHIAEPDRRSLHAVIGVPIRWSGSIVGACVLFSRVKGRRFTAADATLLELFATHAGIAIANARLHALASERAREAARLTERERLVRDIHDTVGRGLVSVLLGLDDADRALADDRDPHDVIQGVRQAARGALRESRRAALGLGPTLLEGRSLHEAVSLELSWVESTASLATSVVVIGDPVHLAPETTRQVFRVIQEALTNVVEHAGARRVRVGLVYGSHDITALIEDDGHGFDVAALTGPASHRGLGLRGLVARAAHLGGSFQIESTPQWGTKVRATFPCGDDPLAQTPQPRWRVLVVHESPVVRAGLVRTLSMVEPDIQVVGEVGDAAQAVEAYGLVRPHVVIVHLDMPRLDGVQLTSHLRAADPDCAIVLLFRSVTDDRLRAAAQCGAVGFVEQDADPAGIGRAVVAAARGDALVSAEIIGAFTGTVSFSPARDSLTAREQEVRALVEEGLPDKQIASRLRISVKTVEKHVGSILRKTGAANRTALARQSSLRAEHMRGADVEGIPT